jgi:hypothetical protein
VRVDADRLDELAALGRSSRGVPRVAFEQSPPVVRESHKLCARPKVDLLPLVLADVADVQVAGDAIEGEPPRVAQPVGDELPARAANEGINARQLAETIVEILRAVLWIAGCAPITHADVEQVTGAELQLTAVVI